MKPDVQAAVDLKGGQDSWFQQLYVNELYVCGLHVCMFLCVVVCICMDVRTTAGQKVPVTCFDPRSLASLELPSQITWAGH